MKKADEKMPQIFTPEKKTEIKAQLLKEGREMMLERGITGMNIEELAASAGIAKGTFYNFFPSKQRFIIEIYNDYTDERLDALKAAAELKKGKLSVNEMLQWYMTLYKQQENPMFHISRRDMKWIREKIPSEELFRPEKEVEVGKAILSMLENVREGIDYRVLANFPKIIEYAVENKDSMHQEVLEENFKMIVWLMKAYVTGEPSMEV